MTNTVLIPKAADAIADRIEMLILEGVLRPGEKLASERELAEKLDISRPTLRSALASLGSRGLLTTTRWGTYVAQFLAPLMDPLATLLADKPHVTNDYFEFRNCIEAEAAGLAAVRATDVDRDSIRRCAEHMTKVHEIEDPHEEAKADVEFHLTVYETSHNLVFLHVMRAVAELLRRDVFYNRKQLYNRAGVRDLLLAQHLAIAEAIEAGNSEDARNAAAKHIRFTSETITKIRQSSIRMEASLNRVGRADFLANVN